MTDDALSSLARWHATVTYRTDAGPLDVPMLLREIGDRWMAPGDSGHRRPPVPRVGWAGAHGRRPRASSRRTAQPSSPAARRNRTRRCRPVAWSGPTRCVARRLVAYEWALPRGGLSVFARFGTDDLIFTHLSVRRAGQYCRTDHPRHAVDLYETRPRCSKRNRSTHRRQQLPARGGRSSWSTSSIQSRHWLARRDLRVRCSA